MEAGQGTIAGFEFGRFRVLTHQRRLLADGAPIELGGRAFDVLMALIEASGVLVGKDTLMNRVWPGRIVEENNLQAHISALRKAFGADRDLIRTVSGRGYQFSGEIRAIACGQVSAGGGLPASLPPTNLPEPVSELIERDNDLGEILSLAAAQRLVTLTGAGGIGKTRLAIEAARRLLPKFADGVWLVELAPLSDPDLVPATIAAAAGLDLAEGEASTERVANALCAKQLLLVLDTCEHLIDVAAGMVETLLQANPTASVIVTSREPLRVEGEWIYRVPPLAVPAEGREGADELLRSSAARLFIDRVRAVQPDFSPERGAAVAIGAICRQLGGIPLAIELAAARVALLGVEHLANHLDDLLRLVTGGKRTAPPRHQTLQATLNWSYELLTDSERVTLRRLAVFSGSFSLRAASVVVASAEVAAPAVIDSLASLIAKSLVSAQVDGTATLYQLLEPIRAYALEKLADSGEHEAVAYRYAKYYGDLFAVAEAEWKTLTHPEWLADRGRCTDDLRATRDWTVSPVSEPPIIMARKAA